MTNPVLRKWLRLSEPDVIAVARAWLQEVEETQLNSVGEWSEGVTAMSFFCPPEMQWNFARIATNLAQTDLQLAAIAVGPLQHLFVHAGEAWIGSVESKALESQKFRRMLDGVCGTESISPSVLDRLDDLRDQLSDYLDDAAIESARQHRIDCEIGALERLKETQRRRAVERSGLDE